MKCPICGDETPDGSEFCGTCGSRLAPVADAEPGFLAGEDLHTAETMITGSVWPCLRVISGIAQGQEFKLQGRTRLGRAQDNEIILDDPKVSRHHAVFNLEAEGWIITDLGSANGTFINDQQILEPYRLQNGDRIRVGDVELSYIEPGAEQPSAPAHEKAAQAVPAAPAAPAAPVAAPAKEKGGIPKWVWGGCAALLALGLLIACIAVAVSVVLPQLQ
ncbi:MAG: FHA domain-containing protein [Anaerolineae bacterium]|nr:FHA domain-containing protein [Anaerolineae bacterium]